MTKLKNLEMPLYTHPTSTSYIDSDSNYTARLTKAVDSNINCFVDGYSAIEFIEANIENTEQFYAFRPAIDNIIAKIQSIYRFTETSVVVSAFRLMNNACGLSLLSDISREPIQTLMLDATMSDLQVQHAHNSNIINFYLDKDGEEIDNRVASIVSTLDVRYFYGMAHRMYGDVLRKPSICDNHEFVCHFEEVAEKTGIVEYYYVENPGGFLVIHENGVIDRYLAQELPEYKKSMSTLVKNPLIDDELAAALTGDTYAADLYDLNGDLNITKIREWRDNLYPLSTYSCSRPFIFSRIPGCYSTDACYASFRAVPSNQMQ